MRKPNLTRRDLLKLSAAAGGASLLAACLPPDTGPSASALPTGTGAGTAASPTAQAKAGRFDLGRLEGPTVISDASKFPRAFKEAPELAALVQQGKLPPVAQRIGQDPIVVQPVHSIGKFGGTLRKTAVEFDTSWRFMRGPAPLLFWDVEWKKIVPNIARSFEMSADQKVITVQLRRGMRWSDGAPFTADDIIFWFEDIYSDKDVYGLDSPDLTVGGKKVVIEKVDQTTLRFISPEPNPFLLELMATPASDLGGQFRQELGRGGPYAPKHHLKQFHAKYVGKEAADRLAQAAKFSGWAEHLKDKMAVEFNTDLPVIYPWVVTVPATNPTTFALERNPYSIWVDTDGNQLPYIGKVSYALVPNADALILNTTSGEVDFMELNYSPAQLPVLVQNEQRGGYKVALDPGQQGVGINLNLAYDADPEIGDLLRNVDFRRALSLGIDRAQINEALFLGTGTPSSSAPASENKYYPGDEWRTKWATLDIAQANQLLDGVGLTKKDSEGYRLRRDGKRLALSFIAVAGQLIDQAAFGEMVKQQWQKIGIDLRLDVVTNALSLERIRANEVQMEFQEGIGTEDVYLAAPGGVPTSTPPFLGVPYVQWVRSGGAQGKEPIPAVKQALDLYRRGRASGVEQRLAIGKDLTRLCVDQVFQIGIISGTLVKGIRVARTNVGNVPARTHNSNALQSPTQIMAQTLYFK